MKRKEAIELLEDLYGAIEDNHGRDYDEAFRMAIEALLVEAKDDWIPCSKGLPNIGEDVLTTDIYGDVDIETLTEVSRSDDVIWEDEDGFYTDFEDIIAWMPKPKPYKGDKKEKKNDA